MLVYATEPNERARASGLAYAFGNGASVLMVLFVLWALMLPDTISSPWVPAEPLFRLSTQLHEPERIIGPIVACAPLLSVALMLLLSRDAAPPSLGLFGSVRRGWRDLRGLVKLYREEAGARRP